VTGQAGPGQDGGQGAGARPVEHGFPHLDGVRASLAALYRRASHDTVSTFAASVRPEAVALADSDDPYLGAVRVADALLRHFRLPGARVVVGYRAMTHAAAVELTAGPEYFVELHERFRTDRRDVGAALAHEITHVYLHRLGLELPGTRDNEILTDTVCAFLGAGWLLLDSYREEPALLGDRITTTASKLGYLTPEEFGYVLAKRRDAFGDDIEPWLTAPRAQEAYREGVARAAQDWRRPPLAGAGWAARRRYARDRRTGEALPGAGYAFDRGAGGLRVAFGCPVCGQRLRLPVRGRLRARCAVCAVELEADT
jgi:hypothetical protein